MRGLTVAIAGMLACAALAKERTDHTGKTNFLLVPRIAFASTRDFPDDPTRLFVSEIYLMNADGTNPERLTYNNVSDFFPSLSPNGKKILYESNLYNLDALCTPLAMANTDDLFVMETDGGSQARLTRGSSGSWSPDSRNIAFHASASYYASGGATTGLPIKCDPGAPTADSDLFVANVDDLLSGSAAPTNITGTDDVIEEDADWSPGGGQIAFTSHPVTDDPDNSAHAEISVINVDGTARLELTHNDYEERAPAWSPDGERLAYMCRVGPLNPRTGLRSFEICMMNADGTGQVRLTSNAVLDATPTWSPDGRQIVFHRNPVPLQLWLLDLANLACNPNAGTAVACTCTNPALANSTLSCATPMTSPPGENVFARWGLLRVKAPK